MAITVRVSTKKLERLRDTIRKPVDKRTAKAVQKAVVELVLGSALSGNSPIAGKGKFPAYRGSYREQIRRGKIPGKSLRPVNLLLDGDFLASLKAKISPNTEQGWGIEVGFFDRKSIKKEQGHREGANNQAKRPLIPQDNEKFNRAINKRLNLLFARGLERRLSR